MDLEISKSVRSIANQFNLEARYDEDSLNERFEASSSISEKSSFIEIDFIVKSKNVDIVIYCTVDGKEQLRVKSIDNDTGARKIDFSFDRHSLFERIIEGVKNTIVQECLALGRYDTIEGKVDAYLEKMSHLSSQKSAKTTSVKQNSHENHQKKYPKNISKEDLLSKYIEMAQKKGADIEGYYITPNGKIAVYYEDDDKLDRFFSSMSEAADFVYFSYNLKTGTDISDRIF